MSESPDSKPTPLRRRYRRFAWIVGVAAALLCGAAFLPQPGRMMALALLLPLAAAALPSMLFNAAQGRAVAAAPEAVDAGEAPGAAAERAATPKRAIFTKAV